MKKPARKKVFLFIRKFTGKVCQWKIFQSKTPFPLLIVSMVYEVGDKVFTEGFLQTLDFDVVS
ncbi:hypothetical protein HNQ56_004521 [Anaerotaenia torta]